MPKYEIVLAIDVPCYMPVVVEADTPEEAATKALDECQWSGRGFDPEWSAATEPRIACDPEECELIIPGKDQP